MRVTISAMIGLKYSALRVKPTTVEIANIQVMPVKKTILSKVANLKRNSEAFSVKRGGKIKDINASHRINFVSIAGNSTTVVCCILDRFIIVDSAKFKDMFVLTM